LIFFCLFFQHLTNGAGGFLRVSLEGTSCLQLVRAYREMADVSGTELP
jgi:hypothetical protein